MVVAAGLVALDVRQAQFHQHAADVLMLELDGAFRSPRELRNERLAMLGLLVLFTQQLRFEHVEVIGHNKPDFALGPILAGLRFLLFFALLDDREAQLAKDEVGLPRCLAAAELFGLKDATDGIAAGQSDNRLGGRTACRRG